MGEIPSGCYMKIFNCVVCGRSFKRSTNDINRGRLKYCSTRCFYKTYHEKTFFKCIRCGKRTFIYWSDLKKRKQGFIPEYCSRLCRTKTGCLECGAKKHFSRGYCKRCYNRRRWVKFNDKIYELSGLLKKLQRENQVFPWHKRRMIPQRELAKYRGLEGKNV